MVFNAKFWNNLVGCNSSSHNQFCLKMPRRTIIGNRIKTLSLETQLWDHIKFTLKSLIHLDPYRWSPERLSACYTGTSKVAISCELHVNDNYIIMTKRTKIRRCNLCSWICLFVCFLMADVYYSPRFHNN